MPKKRYANSMKGMQAVNFVQTLVFAGNTEELPANSIPVSRSFFLFKNRLLSFFNTLNRVEEKMLE